MKTPARVLALLVTTVVMVLAGSAAAMADAPVGGAWPDGPHRSHLYLLVLFGGGTVGLFIVVSLFGLLTARNNYVPPPPSQDLATTGDNTPAHH